MSFRLRPGHRASPELRRVALEEIAAALKHLRAGDVHQTRRTLKQLRALLHLAGDACAREIARHLRDTARLLSETRDLEVCIATLERMERSVGAAEPKVYTRARTALGKLRPLPRNDREKALAELVTTHARLKEWAPKTRWKEIRKTLRQSYEKTRQALDEARQAEASPRGGDVGEAFHELRKRFKRLWSQLRLVRRRNPGPIGKLIKDADRAAELLGGEHDLAILQSRLDTADASAPENLAARRHEFREAALGLAGRFLEEKPSAFAKRCFGK